MAENTNADSPAETASGVPTPQRADEILTETIAAITPVHEEIRDQALAWQDQLTKVPGSLGDLEALGVQLSVIAGCVPPPMPDPGFVGVFAGDHGVQDHQVSVWPQSITYEMGANAAAGGAAVSVLARRAGADVHVYNVGSLRPLPEGPHMTNCPIALGTNDLSVGPAMTREQATQGLAIGINAARDAVASGHKVLIPGELGIGNTTPAAALIAAYTLSNAVDVTGRGGGADDQMLARKTSRVASALWINKVDELDALGVLAAVGGFEHAAMAGMMLGGAAEGVPVILDGVIASSAALAAVAHAPLAKDYFFAGHQGPEPGVEVALNELKLRPILQLGMRLGEGSGAVAALPILQEAAAIMREMATFESAGVHNKES